MYAVDNSNGYHNICFHGKVGKNIYLDMPVIYAANRTDPDNTALKQMMDDQTLNPCHAE